MLKNKINVTIKDSGVTEEPIVVVATLDDGSTSTTIDIPLMDKSDSAEFNFQDILNAFAGDYSQIQNITKLTLPDTDKLYLIDIFNDFGVNEFNKYMPNLNTIDIDNDNKYIINTTITGNATETVVFYLDGNNTNYLMGEYKLEEQINEKAIVLDHTYFLELYCPASKSQSFTLPPQKKSDDEDIYLDFHQKYLETFKNLTEIKLAEEQLSFFGKSTFDLIEQNDYGIPGGIELVDVDGGSGGGGTGSPIFVKATLDDGTTEDILLKYINAFSFEDILNAFDSSYSQIERITKLTLPDTDKLGFIYNLGNIKENGKTIYGNQFNKYMPNLKTIDIFGDKTSIKYTEFYSSEGFLYIITNTFSILNNGESNVLILKHEDTSTNPGYPSSTYTDIILYCPNSDPETFTIPKYITIPKDIIYNINKPHVFGYVQKLKTIKLAEEQLSFFGKSTFGKIGQNDYGIPEVIELVDVDGGSGGVAGFTITETGEGTTVTEAMHYRYIYYCINIQTNF